MTSRRLVAAGGAITAALLFSACATEGSASAGADSASTGTASGTGKAVAKGSKAPASSETGKQPFHVKGNRVSFVDGTGKTVTVPKNPKKVVVTDWSVLRTLADLGVDVDGAPAPSGALPRDVHKAAGNTTAVGDLFEPDYEKISALHPDLVVVAARSGNAKVIKELKKITPNVIDASVRADAPQEVVPLITQRTVQLGAIFGKQKQARAAMNTITGRIDALSPKARQAGSAMFVQVTGGKVSAYGPGSRFGLIYDPLGFTATKAPIDNEGSHGEEISQEFFAQYNPGVLFVLDRGATIGEKGKPALDVLSNGLVATTDAAKNDKIVVVDGFSWYLAPNSPASLRQMLDDAQQAV